MNELGLMVPARSLFGVESGAVTMVLAAMGESPRGVHGAHGLGKPSATDSQRYRSFARAPWPVRPPVAAGCSGFDDW